MSTALLYMVVGLLVFVSIFHSIGGQKRLIGPLLSESNSILDNPTWRAIILFGWHSTTVLMLLIALYLMLVASGKTLASPIMLGSMGIAFVGLGIANGILAKFKHPGWILLSGIGFLTILALYLSE